MQRNAERLLKLVNTLLDFSRLEAGTVQAVFEQLDLPRYTTELASMFESAFDRSGLTLTIDCPPLPERPFVDREMWSKIVLNLLSNALKATFSGGVVVRLREQPDRRGVQLEIRDTGVGIPADELGRLFERFHRVSGAALRSHEGSGIGLALVAELARLHGGDVEVASTLGSGSIFTVRILYGRAHLTDEQVRDRVVDEVPDVARYGVGYLAETLRWLAPGGERPRTPTGADVRRPRVLVVDDNADMREYVSELLRSDYDVAAAPDGAAALELLRAAPPDLVLTDVMMPRLDGFGLLAAMRADPALTHLPVVMLSARSGDEATVEGLEAGADDYLIKPFSARELLARVRANLELDRVRRLVDELQRNQELLDQAEALAHIGSWELDVRTERVRASAEMLRIVRGDAATVDGWFELNSALDALQPADASRLADALRGAVDAGDPLDLEARAVDGNRLLRIRGVALRDPDGAVTHVRGSTQDITEQRAAEAVLARARAEREVAAREHAIATELQQSLLPSGDFDAEQLDIAAFYRPGVAGTQVGGDWHDVIDLGGGRTALVIGDVMGRGVRAAAVMGQLRAAARAYARIDLAPAALLRLLDETVRDISAEMIVTCVYAIFDADDGSLTYANAGHLPPIVTAPGGPPRLLRVGGAPLGTGVPTTTSESVTLEPGATLTLYTDGLVERRGSDLGVGIQRLAELVAGSAAPLPQLPVRLVETLLPDGPDDDVAVLMCRVVAREEGQRSARHDIRMGQTALADARHFVEQTLTRWGVAGSVCFDAQLAVSELATNAINHGRPPVSLRLRLRGETLLVEVRDGEAQRPTPRHAAPHEVNGRGLLIVAAVAHRWGSAPTGAGKTVWCEFSVVPPGAGAASATAAAVQSARVHAATVRSVSTGPTDTEQPAAGSGS